MVVVTLSSLPRALPPLPSGERAGVRGRACQGLQDHLEHALDIRQYIIVPETRLVVGAHPVRDGFDASTEAIARRVRSYGPGLVDHDFLGLATQVVRRGHHLAVGAGLGDLDHVAFLRFRQAAVAAEHVAALADRADHLEQAGGRLVEAREVGDLVPGVVQGRTDQAVHAGVHAEIAPAALALGLGDARQQHAGVGHQVATRLHPQLVVLVGRLDLAQHLVRRGDVQFRFAGVRGYAQAAADVEEGDAADALGEAGELAVHLAPVLRIEHARAEVRVQAAHG